MARVRIITALSRSEHASLANAPKKLRRGVGNRPKMPGDKAAEIARKQRRERVGQMTVQGMSQRAIAAELGVDHATVGRDLAEYLASSPSPQREEIRGICDQRLERSYERLDVQARVAQRMIFETKKDASGNDVPVLDVQSRLAAQALLVRLDDKLRMNNESRRRLHGADAPEQREVGGLGGGPILVTQGTSTLSELMAIVEHNRKSPA
jgi:hypothetical protein